MGLLFFNRIGLSWYQKKKRSNGYLHMMRLLLPSPWHLSLLVFLLELSWLRNFVTTHVDDGVALVLSYTDQEGQHMKTWHFGRSYITYPRRCKYHSQSSGEFKSPSLSDSIRLLQKGLFCAACQRLSSRAENWAMSNCLPVHPITKVYGFLLSKPLPLAWSL